MKLMPRCIELFRLLQGARWLSTGQIHRRFFPNVSLDAARKRLRKHVESRHLVAYREHQMTEALFTLGPEGKRVLEQLKAKTTDVHESDLEDRSASLSDLVTVTGKKYGEGKVVRYIAFVVHAKYSNVQQGSKDKKFGESVNCYRPDDEENDIHIMLGQSLDDEPCDTVTSEMSPHFRPVTWTPDNLIEIRRHPVRITGPLFFDSSHKPCKNGSLTDASSEKISCQHGWT